MSKKENKRAMVLAKVERRELTAAQAGEVMGLSVRQVRRLLAEFRKDGPASLVHGNRGRQPHHTLAPSVRRQILEMAQAKYVGFNHSHLTEKLQEVEEIAVSRSTVRRILVNSGIKSPRQRRPPKHRRRRERMAQKGMMLQIDASRHNWLEGRGPWLSLIGAVDDATGEVPYALFRDQEDSQGYFLLTQEIARCYGLPLAIYSDRHSIFTYKRKDKLSLEEELNGEQEPTQFGRLLKELEIQAIFALSPQAKGRVERLWGTFQDRLVSELRLSGAQTLDEANQVLWKFLPEYNRRFSVPAAEVGSSFRALPLKLKLEEVFCFKYQRVVSNDNTVSLDGTLIQIPPGPARRSYAKARVTIHEGMDGTLGVYYQGQRIAFLAPSEPKVVLRTRPATHKRYAKPVSEAPKTKRLSPTDQPKLANRDADGIWKPAANHPWRRSSMVTKSLNN